MNFTNITLRERIRDASAIKDESGGRVFSSGERLMLLELAMTYNPIREGCHPSGKSIADKVELCDRVFRFALNKAEQHLGLRWIKLKSREGKGQRSKYANNSYDFRHIDSRALPAWRGDGKVWVFDNRGNIDENFNGGTLSFTPFAGQSTPRVAPSVGDNKGTHPLDDWYKAGISNGSYELAALLSEHEKKVLVSKDDTLANALRITSSTLEYADQCAIVRYATLHGMPKILPDKWNTSSGGLSDSELLKDALRK